MFPMVVTLRLALLLVIAAPLAGLAQDAPLTVRGRVFAADNGSALPRARVTIVVDRDPGPPIYTDDQGRFTVAAPSAAAFTLSVVKAGYAAMQLPLQREALATAPARDMAIALTRSAAVSGRVVDTTGETVIGARVYADRVDPDATTATHLVKFNTATDDRGEYRLGGLPAGRYSVTATGAQDPDAVADDRSPTWRRHLEHRLHGAAATDFGNHRHPAAAGDAGARDSPRTSGHDDRPPDRESRREHLRADPAEILRHRCARSLRVHGPHSRRLRAAGEQGRLPAQPDRSADGLSIVQPDRRERGGSSEWCHPGAVTRPRRHRHDRGSRRRAAAGCVGAGAATEHERRSASGRPRRRADRWRPSDRRSGAIPRARVAAGHVRHRRTRRRRVARRRRRPTGRPCRSTFPVRHRSPTPSRSRSPRRTSTASTSPLATSPPRA